MSKDEAMKLALEALEPVSTFGRVGSRDVDTAKAQEAITALQEELAQQEQQPVLMFYEHEWQGKTSRAYQWLIDPFSLPEGTKLYTSPPAQQEPVEYWTVANGWVSDQAEVPAAVWVEPDFWEHCNRVNCGTAYRLPAPGRQPLYTSPPAQRKPLTDEKIRAIVREVDEEEGHIIHFARAIEAAHGIKENT